jgi:N-acetyl sugar amidotransferase
MLIKCKNCLLDSNIEEIKFDEDGICNCCNLMSYNIEKKQLFNSELNKKKLNKLISKIQQSKNKDGYNCVLGMSGGVDSSYLAHLCDKHNLKPLVAHFDNGWNTIESISNIENIITKLNFDLHTFVMDWEEFKDLQLAYLKASVIDIEIPTDQLIFAALNKIAAENNIKFILSGFNLTSEGVMPLSWIYPGKFDLVNLRNIHKKFGKTKLKKLPKFGKFQQHWYYSVKGISTIKILNYVSYNKNSAKSLLKKTYGWKDYGGKHCESIFTRFYQSYILPQKFGVDKRRAHLSSLIGSNQITKEKALEELKSPILNPKIINEDKEYVLKKLKLTQEEFEKIMKTPIISHKFYGTDDALFYKVLFFIYRAIWFIPIKLFRFLKIIHNPVND